MQLEMLSNLRNLQTEIVNQVEDMSIHYDLKSDIRYQQGAEEALIKPITKMLKRGDGLTEIADFLEISVDDVIAIINKYQIH